MKNTIKLTSFLLILALSGLAQAAESGWTNSSQVKKIAVTAAGGINVYLLPELSGCDSQSGYGEHYASILPGHPGLNLMLSNLLAAKTTKTPVQLYLFDDKCTAVEMILHDG